ncbi:MULTISPECIES: TAXI family TRAP transporter solute-binding subunit [unclassified Polaromonas]|uniref:TAXI family TRAP transporter solute-binding subunit n=1 Tax=unclassified Polaromonas TaxID=2638319 RepID=UPI0018C912F3|nr:MULTISPECIES: TAXI family TRAP transporter solute-binding subunit [unclassified Polaromonas]MBG6074157.1 TRAP-type uncharacterized transport system substrate-binding protein [Polaromonas sp. CG_9.7]MBG6116156.1 TRAP-type uncharacterized transport system substrate-binding protein [Polaromonas sp. CG_9.2]MDH6186647.1 TRAP-type uncharacterized transport system substrate-binding protein [Polaromonas sp. CG_23.6]
MAALYLGFRVLDPVPPNRLVLVAGAAGSRYDGFARQYAQVLARQGITLEIRHAAGAVDGLAQLRDASSGVQAALTTFGFTETRDALELASLGGVYDAPIFVFYRGAEPITRFDQLRGKRLSIGVAGTALRPLIRAVLQETQALDASTQLVDMEPAQSLDALIAGGLDAVVLAASLGSPLLQRALDAPSIRMMNVAQAEAIAKAVPGLRHVVLWRGLISLGRDVPSENIDLLGSRNRLLVRKDLHPALQYMLLEAMREVHWQPGPFNRIGEYPSEQASDLPLSPTAQAFYRDGPSFWRQYTSFWLASLLDRVMFFVIPIFAMLVPLISFAPRTYRWLRMRRIDRLHGSLASIESELELDGNASQLVQTRGHLSSLELAVRSLKVARPFVADLHRLRVHLRMVQESLMQREARVAAESTRPECSSPNAPVPLPENCQHLHSAM